MTDAASHPAAVQRQLSMARSVGLIGLGHMGGAMCRTLVRDGWLVVAWDVANDAVDRARGAGAEPASDPADLASRVDVVITSVPDAAAVRSLALGSRGLVEGPFAGGILVDTSTISKADVVGLAADLSAFGVGFLDAPVSGGVRGAEAGELAVMVGGQDEFVQRCLPVLHSIGKAIVHCGPVGAGQVAKACNQLIVMATHEAIAEALVLARETGLDPWKVREVLLDGYASSPILEVQGPRMLRHDFAPGGKARFHEKDIKMIGELAREAGLELPVFAAAARQMQRLIASGGGELDDSAVVTVVESDRTAPA